MATPLDWDEKELNMQEPFQSSLTESSIVLHILVSHTIRKSGFFFLRKNSTFCLFGLRSIEFALKLTILKLVAELTPPEDLSGVATCQFFVYRNKAYCVTYVIQYFILYYHL